MPGMRLLTLGVGNAFSALYYSSCLAVEADGQWLLIDCPHPVRKMLREASASACVPLELEQIRDVILTHLHADHSSGLESFIYYLRYGAGSGKKARVFTHPSVAAGLWHGHLAGSMEWSVQEAGHAPVHRRPEEFYDLVSLIELDEVQAGPFTVNCRRTQHSVPTTALLIKGGGRCLGYSADTAFDPELIDWLSTADLVVHETGTAGMHTPYEKLAALPAELRARMRLIHYADDFDPAASTMEVLRQGRLYSV
jgi:ribonuclease BN (tRNA processing enzyme)